MIYASFLVAICPFITTAQDSATGGHVIIMGQLKSKANREEAFRKLSAENDCASKTRR
jgi:hypothetical protein